MLGLHSYRVPRNLHYVTIILFSRLYWKSLAVNAACAKYWQENNFMRFSVTGGGEGGQTSQANKIDNYIIIGNLSTIKS